MPEAIHPSHVSRSAYRTVNVIAVRPSARPLSTKVLTLGPG
jgi:hypothetical protein